ncbi:MAG: RNA polymerase sigma factor [Phycisphaerales bacterium JB043]
MSQPAPHLCRLLLECRLGSDASSRELWRTLYPALHACARAILRDDALASDAVQNAFLRLLSTPTKTVRAVKHPRAWMLTVTRNEALQLRRNTQRVQAREPAADIPITTDTDVKQTSPKQSLTELIDALSDDAREIIALRHACSLTFDQAAEVLGTNRNTLAARYKRALDELRARHAPSTEASHA